MRWMILEKAYTCSSKISFCRPWYWVFVPGCYHSAYAQQFAGRAGPKLYNHRPGQGLTHGSNCAQTCLKNALNPVITAASGWFACMLAGAVFVEYIFGWNGLGKQIVEALNQLDLPVVMGAVLVIGFTFVIINILVDIIYARLDPRVRV